MTGTCWTIAGDVVRTQLDLRPAARSDASPTWEIEPVDRTDPVFAPWRERLDRPEDPDDPPAWVDLTPNGLLLRFPGHGTLMIEPTGAHAALFADHGNTEFLAHLVLDHVAPRRLAMLGDRVLHATAVRFDAAGAPVGVGFFGNTGAGKSTMTLRLLELGAGFLADDCLVARPQPSGSPVVIVPSHPGTRAWPDLLSRVAPTLAARAVTTSWGKHVLDLRDRFTTAPVPLHALVQLVRHDPTDGPAAAVRLGPAKASVALVATSFLNERGGLPSDELLRRSVSLAASVPVWELHYPSGLEHLDPAIEVLTTALGVMIRALA